MGVRREEEAVLQLAEELRTVPGDEVEARERRLSDLAARSLGLSKLADEVSANCVTAYRLYLDGLKLTRDVEDRLKSGEPALHQVAALSAAEASLQASREAMPRCEAAIAALRRRADDTRDGR